MNMPILDLPNSTLQRVLAGDDQVVVETAEALLRNWLDPVQVATAFLDPLLVETGNQWATGHVSVYQKHTVTALCDNSLRLFAQETVSGRQIGLSAVVGRAQGERHCLGAKIVSIALRQRGWVVTDLGPSATAGEFLARVEESGPRLVALSVATPQRVPATAAPAAELKAHYSDLWMIVGGRAADSALIDAADLVVGRNLRLPLGAFDRIETDRASENST